MSQGRSSDLRQRLVEWAAIVLILAPPLWILFAVAHWGTDLPYWDQWEIVPLLELYSQGRLELADLAAPHNEHRLFFPRLIMVALAALSGWDVRWELLTIVALALALGVVLWSLSRATLPPRRQTAFLVLASLMVYSPSQWENWTWGWQIQIFLSVLMVVAAVRLLQHGSRWTMVALAVAAGWVAMLSFGNALLLWPLGLVLLWLLPGRTRVSLAVWIVGVAVGLGLFFSGYQPSVPGRPDLASSHLLDLAGYTLVYLGAPLAGSLGKPSLAMGVGALGLVALAGLGWGLLRDRARGEPGVFVETLPWLALAAYAAGSAALTSVGRAGYGLSQALTPRYVTIANFLWLGLLGVWMMRIESRPAGSTAWRGRRILGGAGAALALAGVAHGFVSGSQELASQAQFRAEVRALLVAGRTEELPYNFLFPLRGPLEQRLGWLCREEMGIFREGAPASGCDLRFLEVDAEARASLDHPRGRHVRLFVRHGRLVGLDTPQGRIPVVAGAFVGDLRFEADQVVGWAALEPELRAYAELVICVGQGCVYRGGAVRQVRDDVEQHFSASALRLAGFRVRLGSLAERADELRVFALRDGVAGEITMAGERPPPGREVSYRLVDDAGALLLVPEEGETVAVVAGAVDGQARLRRRQGRPVVRGWAAAANDGPVAEVVVTVDGAALHLPHRPEYRREIAEALERPELVAAGFHVDLLDVPAAGASLRVFAITEAGEAGELPIR